MEIAESQSNKLQLEWTESLSQWKKASMFEMSVQKIIFFIILHSKNLCLSRVVMILASLALGIVHTIDGYDVPWVVSTRIALVNVFMFLCCMFNICDTIF